MFHLVDMCIHEENVYKSDNISNYFNIYIYIYILG